MYSVLKTYVTQAMCIKWQNFLFGKKERKASVQNVCRSLCCTWWATAAKLKMKRGRNSTWSTGSWEEDANKEKKRKLSSISFLFDKCNFSTTSSEESGKRKSYFFQQQWSCLERKEKTSPYFFYSLTNIFTLPWWRNVGWCVCVSVCSTGGMALSNLSPRLSLLHHNNRTGVILWECCLSEVFLPVSFRYAWVDMPHPTILLSLGEQEIK